MKQKIVFLDRDGTIIFEPLTDFKVDKIEKIQFEPDVINTLSYLYKKKYKLVIVSNQDGLGKKGFSKKNFYKTNDFIIKILNSQNIFFESVLICPHLEKDNCSCRKPKTKMITSWLQGKKIDKEKSMVIGDRLSDMELAKNMNILGILYNRKTKNWKNIKYLLSKVNRYACIHRISNETDILVKIWLDRQEKNELNTGISFFDHMLEQIAVHGGFRIKIKAKGDLHIDDHHTIEDTGITLGKTLLKALNKKKGIGRYGFVLPMDESLAKCVLDISGRSYFKFYANFRFRLIHNFSVDMVEHFFRSLSNSMGITLHMEAKGKNDHHIAESLFKSFGRTLRQAIVINDKILPSSKGTL
ncbi:bifunctional histidinol-phosphatase/imidazoleglycerol-phosphate dehydratase HisB [Candidatus Tachikawaea gelatinosa]|uniref:Imidazoleglycerol-phosphate dehydratase n=1 Tax=Candidatus Tachikawaea gelatinosa TaxID=1410383 RepID=A0A090AS66_9ENTR|nr:bifunctional histidinol-phosphatase/imidazoleglycerol-phosphate dehydratase HisB [Candidatus Tachikawaea gelatinosa]BAP58705.1 imidazole glycerol-phosphate dehydratase/histidinol phosphatase [Candidatus Tachikawaea gelatinosa]